MLFSADWARCLPKRIALFHHKNLLCRPDLRGIDFCKSYRFYRRDHIFSCVVLPVCDERPRDQ